MASLSRDLYHSERRASTVRHGNAVETTITRRRGQGHPAGDIDALLPGAWAAAREDT